MWVAVDILIPFYSSTDKKAGDGNTKPRRYGEMGIPPRIAAIGMVSLYLPRNVPHKTANV
jgi:hypothetical protein